ncbi:unnamed protein product [Chrysoparadoxa australica]
MLVSHSKKFIFLKTVKTAGTSIEGFLERFCMPDSDFTPTHHRPETVSTVGIIGQRGSFARDKITYYNHMPAKEVKQLLGEDIWSEYTKISAIRNPYDKVVSRFFFDKVRTEPDRLKNKDLFTIRTEFETFIKAGNIRSDRAIYTINNEVSVNYFIRYEHLHKDLQVLSTMLDLDFDPSLLPTYKSEYRRRDLKLVDLISPEYASIIENVYEFEFKEFGYTPLY